MTAGDESNASEPSAEGAPPAEPEDRIAAWVGRALVPPAWASTLRRWMERQLVSDQYARLEQAGHHLEEAIPLAPVFVDLEVSSSPQTVRACAFRRELGFVWQAVGTAPKFIPEPHLTTRSTRARRSVQGPEPAGATRTPAIRRTAA